jgi:hypothetical protein
LGFSTAVRTDQAFFQAHPELDEYCRKFIVGEVPSSFDRLNVSRVLVRQISDKIFQRLFFDSNHREVGHSLYVDVKVLPPTDGPELDRFCVSLFRILSPLNVSED